MRAEGNKEDVVAKTLGTSKNTAGLWTRRYLSGGIAGLKDAPGRGRKPWLDARIIEKVITRVTQPPPGRVRWSVRSMARFAGISRHSVHTPWRRDDLKPHRVRTFKISKDPLFEQSFARKAHRRGAVVCFAGARPAVRRVLLTHGVRPPLARYRSTLTEAVTAARGRGVVDTRDGATTTGASGMA